jgi:hypothetical protein
MSYPLSAICGGSEPDDASALPSVSDPGEIRCELLYRQLGSTGGRASAIALTIERTSQPLSLICLAASV